MIAGLNHITLAVSDVSRSLQFYTDTLGLTAHVAWEGGAYLSAGDLWLCLSLDKPSAKDDYTHVALTVEPPLFEPFVQGLIDKGVTQWKENTSEGNSLYMLDPDGHKLEIHDGNLNSRLASLKNKPYKNLKWL